MIVRVADAAKRALDQVIVATDDARIAEVVEAAGHTVKMTPASCPSGTDRMAIALSGIDFDLAVNVQGDEPLIDPDDIRAVIDGMRASGAPMGTLSRPLDRERFSDLNLVKVVTDRDNRALYFSRAPIAPDVARLHVGLYAFTAKGLSAFTALEPSPLEKSERLEQLRALENGISIHVASARSPHPSIAIDTPEDVARVLAVLDDPQDPRSTHAAR